MEDATIYEAGYWSSSSFYESGSHALGMPPSDLRRGGEGVSMHAMVRDSVLGRVLVAATSRGVCAIFFGEDDAVLLDDLRQRFPRATLHPSNDALDALSAQVIAIVDTAGLASNLPLDLMGTAFQQRVWKALREIPSGTTSTYSEIARRIGAPRAVRAVGTACGRNPVSVVVPCHRVLREDGALGGYRWGLERKKALLAQERAK